MTNNYVIIVSLYSYFHYYYFLKLLQLFDFYHFTTVMLRKYLTGLFVFIISIKDLAGILQPKHVLVLNQNQRITLVLLGYPNGSEQILFTNSYLRKFFK
ncbi:hypothetical protein Glove_227g20 [Diversispora epigaea]|uniref:Uncharacterized protein n=1 Tax=Diversispora epigaea TaxID=1348612 RepID=A0A397IMU2_9GLOM|nr:hypothetical protein Glove_227g20 [Diversispora epigaea]